MDHAVDAIVCGVGSGGTLTGLTRFFRHASPSTEFVLADPKGSILADYIRTGDIGIAGSWLVEGIGEDFIPPIADLSGVKAAYEIPDAESFAAARDLLRIEGVHGGSSTGTLLAAALRYCREQTVAKRVVTLVCDTGTRYLSKVYNDNWMIEQGLLPRKTFGDLRDLIARRFDEGGVVSVTPSDPLQTAFVRMRYAEVSQLPVIDGGHIVGLLDESDILARVRANPSNFSKPATEAMTVDLEILSPDADIGALQDVLDRGLVALIAEGDVFFGLITRFDLLNHLRRKAA
jgi:cystathionine beta-synthase